MSYFAEYEAKKISRRTKSGLERARSEGKQIGRPSKFEGYKGQLMELKEKGASKAEMKRQTGLSYNTVKKYLKRIEEQRDAP
jgi:DNA invertase Pin-like site-specific DNA recombinase